ncbi:hypothetical protein Taro_018455 [Colocasia esculenta]|uniref:Uncharacterized protein n=1 Tax=Colocasia esculenta TaxID=4460 RepID=A0A843UW98_COLES|nr:hypothetical protein [Colocasia esculenta]
MAEILGRSRYNRKSPGGAMKRLTLDTLGLGLAPWTLSTRRTFVFVLGGRKVPFSKLRLLSARALGPSVLHPCFVT